MNSHGLPKGTKIGGTKEVGKLLCDGGSALFFSCLVGKPPFFGLGTPPTVVDFCKSPDTPPGAKVAVSTTVVFGGEEEEIEKGMYCPVGNYKCFECLESPKGWANDISCTGSEIVFGNVKTKLSKNLLEYHRRLERAGVIPR